MANTKVTSRVLANDAVLTANIADDQVTTAKIADDVALGGNPTTTTQTAGNNTTRIATTAFVTTAVANIVDSAPSALDTLNELAAALGDDANFSTTVTNSIAAKLPLSGGTMTGNLAMGSNNITSSGTITGTLATAAQPNITSVGTLTSITSSGSNDINGTNDLRLRFLNGGSFKGGIQVPTTSGDMITGSAVNDLAIRSGANMLFASGGATERMRIDSSGNVTLGSGTNVGTAGTITMNVGSTSSGGGLQLFAPTGAAHGINFGDAYSTSAVYAGAIEYNHASNYMRFFTGSSERMRIDSSGNVGIGNSIPSSFFAGASSLVAGDGSGDDGITIYSGNASLGRIHFADGTSGDAVYAGFIAYNHADNDMLLGGRGSGTTIMTLEANGSVGAPSGTNIYNASDRRVKQNITTLSDSLTIVKALNPVKFNWIEDFSKSENDKTLYGFVAQEVQTVFPDAVESFASGQPIKAGDVTVDNPLAVREKFLIPVLVKAIQEQQEQIEQLKTEIQTLKGE